MGNEALVFISTCLQNYFSTCHQNKDIIMISALPVATGLYGWYIFLKNRTGVYDFTCLRDNTFVIKYYPGLDEDTLMEFSYYEQSLRNSELFFHDEENVVAKKEISKIPRADVRKEIIEKYFTVGKITFFFERGKLKCLELQSQDYWRQYIVKGIKNIITPKSKENVVLNRNVPGWELSYEFLTVLLNEVFAYSGIYPKQFSRFHQLGIVSYSTEEGEELLNEKSNEVSLLTHSYSF